MRQPTPDVLGALLGNLKHTMIDIADIRTDGGTQMRAGLNAETVEEYRQWLDELARKQNGLLDMPPVIVYHDGETYWLADGFHRLEAWKQHGSLPTAVHADLRSGTRRDAVLHAAGANADHGLRRTNADKRRSVEVLLRDDEWAKWSDGEIARKCMVSQNFVSTMRRELTQIGFESPTERKGADGRVYNTAKIGTEKREYVAVWQLESPVRAWIERQCPNAFGDQIDLAKGMQWIINGERWNDMTATLPTPWRIGDVKQACNNVADQLRQEVKRRSTVTPPAAVDIPLRMVAKDAPLPGATTTDGDDLVDHTTVADDGRPVDIPSNLADAGWKAVKKGQLFSASSARGDRIGGHASFNNLCDEMYRIQREHNAATAAATAIPADEGLGAAMATGVPVPVRHVVDALLYEVADRAYSADTMTLGKYKIRKPFAYDGAFWTCLGGSSQGSHPENDICQCLRIHPISEEIAPGEHCQRFERGYYDPGTPVAFGQFQYVLGAQWLIVQRGPVEALTVTPDVPAGKPMIAVFRTDEEQAAVNAARDLAAREQAADEAARQFAKAAVAPATAKPLVEWTDADWEAARHADVRPQIIATDGEASGATAMADDATRAGIAVIDGTAVALMTQHLRTAALSLGSARAFLPFGSEWHGAIGVLIDDIKRIEKDVRK